MLGSCGFRVQGIKKPKHWFCLFNTVFPNLFLASAPFSDKQISIAPLPCVTHISTQFFRIVDLVCLKMIKTRMSTKMQFTIKLNSNLTHLAVGNC